MKKRSFAEKHAFASRLATLMEGKGWSQSDLARVAFGEYTDPRTGYIVAYGRDNISAYLAAKKHPDPKTLRMLARALGVTERELVPQANPQSAGADRSLLLGELEMHLASVQAILKRVAGEA